MSLRETGCLKCRTMGILWLGALGTRLHSSVEQSHLAMSSDPPEVGLPCSLCKPPPRTIGELQSSDFSGPVLGHFNTVMSIGKFLPQTG